MDNNFLAKLDAFLFRFFGVGLGLFGSFALVKNNGWDKLSHNPYGVGFLIVFLVIALFSLYSIFFTNQSAKKE